MFQNLESHGSSIHESTSQTVDSLVEFIVKCYHGFEKYTRKKLDEYLKSREQSLKKNNSVNSLNKLDKLKPVSAEIQINGKQVYAKQGEHRTVNQLTQNNLDRLKAAFDRPELVEGSVCILIDNKSVLRIEEGQVVQDDLGLTKSQLIEPSLEPENNSEKLITQAGSLLITNYGYQVSEDISAFHGHNYCYEQSDESLTIRAYGRGDVFKDGEFTATATESDRQTLTQLPEKVEQQLNQDRQQQQQQQQQKKTPLRLSAGK